MGGEWTEGFPGCQCYQRGRGLNDGGDIYERRFYSGTRLGGDRETIGKGKVRKKSESFIYGKSFINNSVLVSNNDLYVVSFL